MAKPVTYRNQDQVVELEVEKFLDKKLYSGGSLSFERCDDKKLQLQGIDGFLSVPSLGIDKMPADEKAGIHYVNRPIPTYLMELSQVRMNGMETDGWFLSAENQTEYYVLMYLYADVDSSRWMDIKEDNISLLEYYIVGKRDIMKYVNDCGFPRERLLDGVRYLRQHPEMTRVKTSYDFSFVISRQFKECPVNLCIHRNVYDKIAVRHGFVNNLGQDYIVEKKGS